LVGIIDSVNDLLSASKQRVVTQLEDAVGLMQQLGTSISTQRRVMRYFQYLWSVNGGIPVAETLDRLPDLLRSEVAVAMTGDMIARVSFLKDADKSFCAAIAARLTPLVAVPGQYIFRSGEMGAEMFFLKSGRAEVLVPSDGVADAIVDLLRRQNSVAANSGGSANTSEKCVRQLIDGDCFGEMALLFAAPRSASIRASEHCELFRLEKRDLDMLLNLYPNERTRLVNQATQRMRRKSFALGPGARPSIRSLSVRSPPVPARAPSFRLPPIAPPSDSVGCSVVASPLPEAGSILALSSLSSLPGILSDDSQIGSAILPLPRASILKRSPQPTLPAVPDAIIRVPLQDLPPPLHAHMPRSHARSVSISVANDDDKEQSPIQSMSDGSESLQSQNCCEWCASLMCCARGGSTVVPMPQPALAYEEPKTMENDQNSSNGSQDVVKDEETSPVLVLIPNSTANLRTWNLIVFVATMYNIMIVPYRCAFSPNSVATLYLVFDYVGDSVLMFNMWATSRTSFIEHGLPIVDAAAIFARYTQSIWCVFDAISCVPILDWIALGMESSSSGSGSIESVALLRLPRMFLLIGMVRAWLARVENSLRPHQHIRHIGALVAAIVLISHWVACLYWSFTRWDGFAPVAAGDSTADSWLPSETYAVASPLHQWLRCMFFAITSLTGMGAVQAPQTSWQALFSVTVMLFGKFVLAFLIGNVAGILSDIVALRTRFFSIVFHINQFLKMRAGLASARNAINSHFEHSWSVSGGIDPNVTIRRLPDDLHADIVLEAAGEVLRQSMLFGVDGERSRSSEAALRTMALLFKFEEFPAGATVYQRGHVGDKMFLIIHGTIGEFEDDVDDSSLTANRTVPDPDQENAQPGTEFD
jgi:CRP-like cAMP-binding protein